MPNRDGLFSDSNSEDEGEESDNGLDAVFGKIKGDLSEEGITEVAEDMFQAKKTGQNQMTKSCWIVVYKVLQS